MTQRNKRRAVCADILGARNLARAAVSEHERLEVEARFLATGCRTDVG
jgi:transposase